MVILALSEVRLRRRGRVCLVELLVEKSKECKRKRLSAQLPNSNNCVRFVDKDS